jgi:predicted nucleic acid-binding protein
MIVVDATVLIDFFIGTPERKASSQLLLTEDSAWVSLSLWRYELGNALRTSVRSRETTLDEVTAQRHLVNAETLVTETIEELDTAAIFQTAIKHGLTMYDASYVWAARARGIKLRTRDSEVLQFCPDCSLPMP